MKIIFSLLLTASVALALDAPKIERNSKGEIIIAAPDGSHARYSIDGSKPHAKSGPYLAPIILDAGGTVKAVSVSPDRKTVSAPTELAVEPQVKAKPSSIVPCTQDRDFPIYDWAIRHSQVTELTTKKKASLVFIGDSITQMFGGEPHDRSQPGKDVWEKYYGSRNATNLGFGYDFTENAIWRLQHGELDGAAAKAVVLNIGTNNMGKNSPEEIAAGVKAVLNEVRRSQPSAKILLLGIYPRGAKPDATREKVTKTNTLLAELDGKENVTFLDVSAKLVGADGTIAAEVMRDFLHPTAKGYEIIAEAIDPTLKKLLGE